MPSRKKSKGKARKAKAPKERSSMNSKDVAHDVDEIDDVAGGLRDLCSMDSMMERMRGQMISSLGDGYDAESLKLADKKMCDYFLSSDSIYYDDETQKKSPNPTKPTDQEVEYYKKSDIIRRAVLRKASSISATGNFLAGQGYKNMDLYQQFWEDLMTYHYAWFEIIFKKERSDLLSACNVLVKFATEKLKIGGRIDMIEQTLADIPDRLNETIKIMAWLSEMKDMFQSLIKDHDKEGCDDAGYLEYDFYELNYKMSVKLASQDMIDEAEQYFDEAFSAENIWGYWDEENRHCGKVLEYAIGRGLSKEDLAEIDEYAMENSGFYFLCLESYLNGKKGIVPWKSSGSYNNIYEEDEDEEHCDNCGIPASVLLEETGQKLLRCARCKVALYCNRDCQVKAWKNGHKRECN